MDAPALRRILLELIGTARRPSLAGLSTADWAMLDRMAVQHRLQPLLHAQHRDNRAIPGAIAAGWRAAHRAAAITALAQVADLRVTVTLLEDAGFAPIALKGAWLAHHAYPEAAQRPARDIDLLLDSDTVMPAFDLLLSKGYSLESAPEMALADVLRLDKHMPPLLTPGGTRIELHQYLWEREGRLSHAIPAARDADFRQRATRGADGLLYPASADMLAHLIIHAIYSHRLDCGPLLLPDLDFLLRKAAAGQPDFWADFWREFWARAAREGWQSGARLVLELVAHYREGALIDFAAATVPAPADLLSAAPDLLLQELDTRRSAGFAAAALTGGPGQLFARLRGTHRAQGERAATRDMTAEGGFSGWASSRLIRTLGELSRRDVRRQSRELARLSKWLDQ